MARLRNLDDEVFEAPFNRKLFTRVLVYLKPYKKQMFVALLLMIIAACCSLAGPLLIGKVVDGITKGEQKMVFITIGIIALLTLIGTICLRYRVKLMDTAGRKAISTLRHDLFTHIQSLSLPFFDSRSAGKIMVRVINDVNSLNNLFTGGIINVLIDVLTLFFLVGIMLVLHWKLTLISFSTLILLMIVLFVLKKKMRKAWQIVRTKTSTMNGYLHESLAGMRVTQAFVREEENQEIFEETNKDIHTTWMKAVSYNNMFWPFIDTLSVASTIIVYFFGMKFMGSAAGMDQITLDVLISILLYLGRFWGPINNLSNFYNNLLTAMASLERIFEIMDTKPEVFDVREDLPELPPIQGYVDFQNVSFEYEKNQPVLQNVSFHIEPGETIALVGPTGAGKSTVVNLISRFYDVTGGALLIDGYDVREVKLHSLRSQMSVMLQDSFMFSGTVYDNIQYGRLDATREEVIQAAKAVYAHDFIEKLPKGYDTEITERGSTLSVGQRQLISFARALLNDPKILILDEATSSIDTHTEMMIQQALDVLLQGRTSFVIAHRLSTIRKADKIMVIDNHGIAEAGSHEELMVIPGGAYRKLSEAQYKFMEG
ncbi:MAG: ABC transporter ATP-binding protein [Clostridiales bacterium]|nr:ABC transporter ATP-binding protein [Clostridiales bacterium]